MPVNDPIGDFLTRMRNAQHGRLAECRAGWSKIKQSMCELLKEHGYLDTIRVEGEGSKKEIAVTFRKDRAPLTLKRISTPGSRKYVGKSGIRALLHGNDLAILTTSSGLLTHHEAIKRKIGGELICTIS
ncbi:30S ribosomal protein S8 [Candidatus Peribacteria bacterium RIFCSPLOWO2_01_FULL_51_18]|nr:MAG: 30S ribosomal protein S8 [Candidatus Peribacteria bacterium RIFCSPHIGHO2_02_FULL_51_15]OGJ65611.1 MAG: 30S ribosomal protein S8 [Candidatus Peribacteria bacterium RIFCSPLOWO2_01_FULL_51_18]OGJ69261.1 MAG: 30S ribosomal protein S8 [Candidatus Peribacteria bacterium RIFCSPLOWO2_02_FULL_51_10]